MKQGFTLVELLVVITILMILSATVLTVLNPMEIVRRAHDTARITDVENLRKGIDLAMTDRDMSLQGTTAVPVTGSSNDLRLTRKADGSGWVSYNKLANYGLAKYLAVLPIDPVNDDKYYYRFASDGETFEIDCKFESVDYVSRMDSDGGNNPEWYEIGTSPGLSLLPPS